VISAFIQNCSFILDCPAHWNSSGPPDDEGVRYWDACRYKVSICNTQHELRIRIEQNDCVAVQLHDHDFRQTILLSQLQLRTSAYGPFSQGTIRLLK